jgi:hypothetical protein
MNFEVKKSTSLLNKLRKYTKNLNQDEKSILESCSSVNSYEIVKYFTKSSDASIFLVKRKRDGKEFIQKRFLVDSEKDTFNTSLKEVLMLIKLKHKLICGFKDFYIEEQEYQEEIDYYFSIIMPKYAQDLRNYVQKVELEEEQINELILELSNLHCETRWIDSRICFKELKNDKDVVLLAVKQYGRSLNHASQEIQKDKDVVLAAVKQESSALEFVHKELQNDKDVVLDVVKKDGTHLEYAKKYQDNKDIVWEAVKQNGVALKFTSKEFQNDKELVLEALKTFDSALKHTKKEYL